MYILKVNIYRHILNQRIDSFALRGEIKHHLHGKQTQIISPFRLPPRASDIYVYDIGGEGVNMKV